MNFQRKIIYLVSLGKYEDKIYILQKPYELSKCIGQNSDFNQDMKIYSGIYKVSKIIVFPLDGITIRIILTQVH